jgi:predicted MFS family arabinose efflux permease
MADDRSWILGGCGQVRTGGANSAGGAATVAAAGLRAATRLGWAVVYFLATAWRWKTSQVCLGLVACAVVGCRACSSDSKEEQSEVQ